MQRERRSAVNSRCDALLGSRTSLSPAANKKTTMLIIENSIDTIRLSLTRPKKFARLTLVFIV